MKVAVISSSIADGSRIAAEIEKESGVEAWILVIGTPGRNQLVRILLEVYRLATLLAIGNSLRMVFRRRILYFRKPIESAESLARIRDHRFDLAVHNVNVIYRGPVIAAFGRGILNAHIGILPRYRGRCVAEWSLLEGSPTGITVFFVDEGVDTGRDIVLREEVPVRGFSSIVRMKSFLFGLNAQMYAKGLRALISREDFQVNRVEEGLRYYPMSQLFLKVVEQLLCEK